MSTNIRTAKTSYVVTGVEAPAEGPHALIVRQPSGKARRLTRSDVGRPRFDAAVANFFASQRARFLSGGSARNAVRTADEWAGSWFDDLTERLGMRPHEKYGRVWRKNGRGWTRAEKPHKKQPLTAACFAGEMLLQTGVSLLPYQLRILRIVLENSEAEFKT